MRLLAAKQCVLLALRFILSEDLILTSSSYLSMRRSAGSVEMSTSGREGVGAGKGEGGRASGLLDSLVWWVVGGGGGE